MSKLRDLVRAEIARRAAGDGKWPVLTFIVHEEPGALMDAEVAAKAIIAEADNREAGAGLTRITVNPAIADAVVAAIRVTYPRRMLITKPIIESPNRHAANLAAAAQERDDDRVIEYAAERAKARLAKMRGAAPR